MLLIGILPVLAEEFEELLEKAEEPQLAAQGSQLTIPERCRSGDDCCASFYRKFVPQGSYGPGHRCVELEPANGMLILDVLDGTIVHDDVLNRNDSDKGSSPHFREGMLARTSTRPNTPNRPGSSAFLSCTTSERTHALKSEVRPVAESGGRQSGFFQDIDGSRRKGSVENSSWGL